MILGVPVGSLVLRVVREIYYTTPPSGFSKKDLKAYTPPRPINPKNWWLVEIYEKWTSLPNSIFPNQQVGREILVELLNMECEFTQKPGGGNIRIIVTPTFSSGVVPSLELVFRDIMESEKNRKSMNITDCTNGFQEPSVHAEKFLASFFKAAVAHEWTPRMRHYSALDIEVSQSGLGLCEVKPHPFDKDPTFAFSSKGNKADPPWTAVLTPPGCVTHIHSDGIGSSQYMIHFEGTKLWLFWPPCEKNLSLYAHQHGQIRRPTMTLESIRNMEGMEVYLLDGTTEAFVVPPNYLHAVISLTPSAHMATYFCGYTHFEQSLTMMHWFLQWAKDFSVIGHTVEESLNALKQLQDEIVWWEALVKENKTDTRTPSIALSLLDIKYGTNKLLSSLSGETQKKKVK